MEIDKEKLIKSGAQYIYALDEYPASKVEKQIKSELDEILELNRSNIAIQRRNYFEIGKELDYLHRIINTSKGSVLAGIRHINGDKSKPFIFIWSSFNPVHIKNIIQEIYLHFKVFKPQYYSYWARPDIDNSKELIYQQRFIGRISELKKSNHPLEKAVSYFQWYQKEYHRFHQKHPEFINRISINDKETMEESLQEDLLYFYTENDQRVGLIAGEHDTFLGKPSIYLNEILISEKYRRKGYANKLLSSFVAMLNAEYLISHIDAANVPSRKTALRTGQKIFSQEVFASI